MLMLIALGVSLLLSFSYKIVEYILTLLRIKLRPGTILYTWVITILLIIPFFNEHIIFNAPINIMAAVPGLVIIFLVNALVPRYSGYKPAGTFNILNFAIMYPIIEEIIFRGMMLPYLNEVLPASPFIELLYLPINLSVIITAFLFAISHLQYYKLSLQSTKFMIFAFTGGIIFGAIAHITESIAFTLLLHMEFNMLAIYYAKKTKTR